MPAKITVNKNGPLKIEGEFEIVDCLGNPYPIGGKRAVFLCRCGNTKNAPFCDGQHKACGFTCEAIAQGPMQA